MGMPFRYHVQAPALLIRKLTTGTFLRSRLLNLALAVVTAGLFSAASAQDTEQRIAVYFSSEAEDSIGRQLSFEIIERLRRSAGLTLANSISEARFVIRFLTMDPRRNDQNAGISTQYAAVYNIFTFHTQENSIEMYLSHTMGACGANRVQSCALSIVASFDETVTPWRPPSSPS